MRCILVNDGIKEEEINARMKYIYKIFHLYTYQKVSNHGIEIISIPDYSLNLTIIIGHNYKIVDYLLKNKIMTKTLILITCFKGNITKLNFKNKIVYISKNDNGNTSYYDGKNWGFDFFITESELNLFNSKEHNIIDKIKTSFTRLEDL